MKKIMRLVNVQVWAMLANTISISGNKKKNPIKLYAGVILFGLFLSAASFVYAYLMGKGLYAFNLIDTLPYMYMAITSFVVIFTTVYKVKGTIFGFKDFDLVMSLPVSNSKIVASRLMLLYIINQFFVLIIMIPMMIAYGLLAHPGFMFYLYSILGVFFISLIPIIIASLIGTILTFISMRFKYSNIFYIVFVFAILLAWIFMPLFIQDSKEVIVNVSNAITNRLDKIYPLAGLYAKAVTQSDHLSMLVFTGPSLLSFMLFSWAVGKVFIKINTEVMTSRARADYKMGELRSSSPLKALYIREFKRYFASPVYVLNTAFGMVLLLILSIGLPFFDTGKLFEEIQFSGSVGEFVPVVIIFCMSTSCTTMSSISLEGKNLWILKSLPVSTSLIFTAKSLVNLTILSPAMIASIIMGIVMKISFVNMLLVMLSVVAFALLVSIYGLTINLRFPNLSWTNETVVVKQSASSTITTFSLFGLDIILFVLFILTKNFRIGILIFIGLVLILDIILIKTLKGKGTVRFNRL